MPTVDRKRNSSRKRQGKDKPKGKCWCCRKFLAFLFSHVGLGFLVFSYSLLGAVIFRYFEEPHEKEKASEVLTIRNTTVHNLWSETYKLNVLYKENWTTMASKEIEKFQQRLIQAVKEGYDGKEVGTTGHHWSLSGSWMYSLTVITTIGYGNRPRTTEGKLATIAYAIVGIPLMLLFLTNMGNILAKAFKCLYGYCCNCSNGDSTSHHHNLHAHHHLHDHYHVHHIALNDVSPSGHLVHCNSTSDPYRTTKCYSACNSNAQREQYSVGGVEAETKICTDMTDHHSCSGGTLNRAHSHSHHSILRGTNTDTSDIINSNTIPGQQTTEEQNVSVILCILLIVAYVLFGASLFYVWEGWTILDGSYFCFVTLSTIGFGDLMPGNSALSRDGSQKKLIITSAYIIGGMALIAMSFNLVHKQVLHKVKRCGTKLGLFPDEQDIEIPIHENHDEDFDV